MSYAAPLRRAVPANSVVKYELMPAWSADVIPVAVRGSMPASMAGLPSWSQKAEPIDHGATAVAHWPLLDGSTAGGLENFGSIVRIWFGSEETDDGTSLYVPPYAMFFW